MNKISAGDETGWPKRPLGSRPGWESIRHNWGITSGVWPGECQEGARAMKPHRRLGAEEGLVGRGVWKPGAGCSGGRMNGPGRGTDKRGHQPARAAVCGVWDEVNIFMHAKTEHSAETTRQKSQKHGNRSGHSHGRLIVSQAHSL